MTTHYNALLRSFRNPRILVAGDLLLDRYVWGTVERISPEGPIPVLRVQREEDRPGGAANVAKNLVALGAEASCAGPLGADAAGDRLLGMLEAAKIDASAVITDSSKPTPIKIRCISGSQQMLRIDHEITSALDEGVERDLMVRLEEQVLKADLVILSDYDKGALTREIAEYLISVARRHAKTVVVGPKGTDFSKYRGCSMIVPNLKELALATRMSLATDDQIAEAAGVLLRSLGCDSVVVTRGSDGMSLFRRGLDPFHVQGRSRQVYDVAGAGDTAVASLGLALACHASHEDAVGLANVAGAIAVGKVGVTTVTREEILQDLADGFGLRPGKVLTLSELLPRVKEHRNRHERLAVTNGCFDVLHIGHLHTIRFAKSQAEVLVVAINSDASVQRIKGRGRPIVTQHDRAQVLAALEDVDYVVVFEEDTPVQLLRELKPEVLVKGGDYDTASVVGADVVDEWQGKVLLGPRVEGASTTTLVETIKNTLDS